VAARGQIKLRGAHEALPLLPADARQRAAVTGSRTRTHFDEHQRAVWIAHHQIDLAAAAHDVARDEAQPLPLQKTERVRFELRADASFRLCRGRYVSA